MSWLLIFGGACLCVVSLVLPALAAVYFLYAAQNEAATERRVRETGRPVLAIIVMVNSEFLHETSIASAPALTIFSHDPPSPSLAHRLRDLADDLFDLYTADDEEIAGLPPHQQRAAALVKNDSFHEGRRNQVPLELTQGAAIYLADLWLHRDRLPEHAGISRTLACMVNGQAQGDIILLPPSDPLAQPIYAAAGVAPYTP
ncbi:MAG: hypothetical protein ACIALR_14140 [Blastopirellula sp. JB062]